MYTCTITEEYTYNPERVKRGLEKWAKCVLEQLLKEDNQENSKQ